ncbi:hypothetical protein EY04_27595 [Pseudomonas chlororaphis]|uniref:hypothetical protein n=1 Tax=Pseudomonas chlororaphis TaxID=587753 RepID=UPI0004AC0863|nr:hypothetical protein [Pseudomonas chlororaphis]AIC22541.1 hypothetical protein EY04_27595 [Pseudomonas chlororaphis]
MKSPIALALYLSVFGLSSMTYAADSALLKIEGRIVPKPCDIILDKHNISLPELAPGDAGIIDSSVGFVIRCNGPTHVSLTISDRSGPEYRFGLYDVDDNMVGAYDVSLTDLTENVQGAMTVTASANGGFDFVAGGVVAPIEMLGGTIKIDAELYSGTNVPNIVQYASDTTVTLINI